MVMKRGSDFIENKLVTTVGEVFYTEQKMVVQSDAKKIREIVEILVVEVDQQKYEES